jgi:chemotaxis family two-component system response regulator Rcp1
MLQPRRVLLVEDNPGDADLTRDVLESGQLDIELAIDVAIDGEDALDYLMKRGRHGPAESPDLILLDLNLPRRGGIQVLAEIKKQDRLRTIPVVVLTSSDAEKDIAQSYAVGANCYVTKPGDLSAFIAKVQSIASFWFGVAQLP